MSLGAGKIFTMGSRGDDECVLALDEETGEEVWSVRIGATRSDGMGGGPRGHADDRWGPRLCPRGQRRSRLPERGRRRRDLWSTNILQLFEAGNIGWGISESVLIDGDQLICTPGGKTATMARSTNGPAR